MKEPVPAPLPDPSDDVPKHEKIPQSWVADLPEFNARMEEFEGQVSTFKKIVAWGALALGMAFASIGIVALISLRHSDDNTKNLDSRGQARNVVQQQTDARLDAQQEQIRMIQERSSRAVCALVVGTVQSDRDAGKPISPPVIQFARDYGCVVPQLLGGDPPPLRQP